MLVRSGEPRERLGTGASDGVVDRPRVSSCPSIEESAPCETGVGVAAEMCKASDEDVPGRWSPVGKVSAFAASPGPLVGPGEGEGIAGVGFVLRCGDVDPLVVCIGAVEIDDDGCSDCVPPLEVFGGPLLSEEGKGWLPFVVYRPMS